MSKLHIERIGGLAGFGGALSRLRSHGEIELSKLSAADRQAVEKLFAAGAKSAASSARDAFRYRITRTTDTGTETIEAPEQLVPAVLSKCVHDELL